MNGGRGWSIIIPTFDRPAELAKCVESVLDQTFEGDFEVIVVNDGGRLPQGLPEKDHLHLVTQKNAGPAKARNEGVRRARYPYVAFIDDDCQAERDWLSGFDRAVMGDGRDRVIYGGATVNALDNPWSKTSQEVVDCLYQVLEETSDGAPFFASNNLAMSREVFESMNGFDTSFELAAGEDRAFCIEAAEAGVDFVRVDTARVRHYHSLNLRSFLQQHYHYGKGASQLERKSGKRATLGKNAVLTFINYPSRWPGKFRMFLAQTVTAVGYFVDRRSS